MLQIIHKNIVKDMSTICQSFPYKMNKDWLKKKCNNEHQEPLHHEA